MRLKSSVNSLSEELNAACLQEENRRLLNKNKTLKSMIERNEAMKKQRDLNFNKLDKAFVAQKAELI